MKSFTILAITTALAATAVSAYEHKEEGGKGHGGHGGHHSKPDLSGPGIQVETRPPVVVVKTVTLTKSWNAKPSGKPHWKANKNKHEDEDEDEEEDDKKWKKKGGDDDDDDLHANSLASADGEIEAAEASGLAEFAAAQATSGGMVSSAVAAKTSSVVSKVSSAMASASSSAAAAASGAESVRVGGTFVAAAAGIAAYLLL